MAIAILSQIVRRVARRAAGGHKGLVLAFVDGLLVVAWLASVATAWARPGRRPVGAFAAGLVLTAIVIGLGMRIERDTGGRLGDGLVATMAGLAVVLFGAVLHARARAALGPGWSPRTAPGTRLAVRGPYAYVRHPAYAGLMLMAIGSLLAHCSLAVGAAAIGLIGGLVLKARAEDRRLHERFGEPWRRWASEVPSWCPARLSRRGTRR